MLGRMFVSDETTRLEAAKMEVNAPPSQGKAEISTVIVSCLYLV